MDLRLKGECYGNMELKAINKYGPLAQDEFLTFEPALALGGTESVNSLKTVKLFEGLNILSQLY